MKCSGWKRAWKFVPIVIAACAIFGFFVEVLWNWLMPHIFGWHAITFWQGVGILLLCKILFGRPRLGGGMGWRRGMRERWESMTPEQREKFRQAMGARCGPAPASPGPER